MSSFLERLLLLVAPLFAAASGRGRRSKKPIQRKSGARTTRTHDVRKRVQTTRRASRSTLRKGKPGKKKNAFHSRPTVPHKLPQASTTQVPADRVAMEPLPKPVAPMGRAILLSPENGKHADSVNPKFRWLSVGGATRYEVTWSDKPDLSSSHVVTSIATEAAVPVEKPLRLGVIYYWRVRGGNEGGWGPWSSTASFSVLEENG